MPAFVDEERTLPLGGEGAALSRTLEHFRCACAVHLEVLTQIRLLREALATHGAPAKYNGSWCDF